MELVWLVYAWMWIDCSVFTWRTVRLWLANGKLSLLNMIRVPSLCDSVSANQHILPSSRWELDVGAWQLRLVFPIRYWAKIPKGNRGYKFKLLALMVEAVQIVNTCEFVQYWCLMTSLNSKFLKIPASAFRSEILQRKIRSTVNRFARGVRKVIHKEPARGKK